MLLFGAYCRNFVECHIFKTVLEIKKQFVTNDIKGIKPTAYEKISKSFDIQGQYRTYDYTIAKTSSVYLEPIRVFTKVDDED